MQSHVEDLQLQNVQLCIDVSGAMVFLTEERRGDVSSSGEKQSLTAGGGVHVQRYQRSGHGLNESDIIGGIGRSADDCDFHWLGFLGGNSLSSYVGVSLPMTYI